MSASTSRAPIVAVVGGAECGLDAENIAREVGAAIARRGWHLLCGGGGGVMQAACRGFREAHARGLAIALLPGDDPDDANDWVDVALATGIGLARNALIATSASALVAVDGCAGTLSEVAHGWQMGKPIVAMARSGGWAADLAGTRIDPRRTDEVFAASSAEEAIAHLASRLEVSG
jgi:uncharacterized protein (TIGR00725 family)